MNGILTRLLLLVMLLAFGGEAAAATMPDHDHHSEVTLAVDQGGMPDSDHGKHAIHACGVCHHLVDGRLNYASVEQSLSQHRYDVTSDRVSSREVEPPFQPPIGVSV